MKKRFFIIGFLVVLLVAIPISVYFLKNGSTNGGATHAAASTVLSFNTTNPTVGIGLSVPVDVIADPGTNSISVIKLNISYDSTKLSTASGGLVPNAAAFPTTLDPVTYGPCTGNFCTITATFAIGADPTKAVTTKTTVGTITFKTLAATDQGPTNVTFGNSTTVYSVAQADQASENVLSSTQPLALTIGATASLSGSPTPSITITDTPTPTTGVTDTATPTPSTPMTTTATNQSPLCTSLSVDQNTATPGGTINFTANGNSPSATISKVTFNFGDSNVLDVSTGGGIGTNNVSVQQAHTYPTEGTFTATAIMTDSNNAISNATMCSQTVTIGSVSGTLTPTLPTTLPPTGPSNMLFIIGIGGFILSIVGGFVFFGL